MILFIEFRYEILNRKSDARSEELEQQDNSKNIVAKLNEQISIQTVTNNGNGNNTSSTPLVNERTSVASQNSSNGKFSRYSIGKKQIKIKNKKKVYMFLVLLYFRFIFVQFILFILNLFITFQLQIYKSTLFWLNYFFLIFLFQ